MKKPNQRMIKTTESKVKTKRTAKANNRPVILLSQAKVHKKLIRIASLVNELCNVNRIQYLINQPPSLTNFCSIYSFLF